MSIGLRVDFGWGIKERKKKTKHHSDEREHGEEGGGLLHPPPFLSCSITFFLLSSFRQKKGVPFHPKQGVVRGLQEPFAVCYTQHCIFFPPFPFLFVSLIGPAGHSSLTYGPAGTEIPQNQYCIQAKGKL